MYDDDDDADRDDDDDVDCVASALVKHPLVHKKGADHAGLNHMQCNIAPKLRTYVCWLEARDRPHMAVITEGHKDISYGGWRSAGMLAGRPLS